MTTNGALLAPNDRGATHVTTPLDDLVTRNEAADILQVSPETVDRYARSGEDHPLHLEKLRTGNGRTRYRRSDVIAVRDRRDAVQ